MRTIKSRLLAALTLLCVMTVAIAAIGYYAASFTNKGLHTVYNDRVMPLRDLKAVSDYYAVNIVDTSHKVRDGNIDWDAGVKAVAEAMANLKTHWRAYAGTYMDADEKKLADEAEHRMREGDAATGELHKILQARDKDALDAFVVNRLYAAMDPVSDAIGNLVELQIREAQVQYDVSAKAFDLAFTAMIVLLVVTAVSIVFAIWTTIFAVVRPLGELNRGMHQLAEGNFYFRLAAMDRKDEIGAIAQSVERFKGVLADKAQAEAKILVKARDTLEEKVKERTEELRVSEAKYRELIHKIRAAVVVHGPDTRIITSNLAAQELFGLTETQMLGKAADDPAWGFLREDESAMPPEETPVNRVLATQAPLLNAMVGIRRPATEGVIWALVDADPVFDARGALAQVIVTLIDITERRQAGEALRQLNRKLKAISDCNQALMRADDELALLNEICRIICGEAGYRMAWVGYAEHDDAKTVRPVAWAGAECDYLATAAITWADVERGRGPTGNAIRSGKSAVIQDFATDLHAALWRENAQRRGYRSSIALPLRGEDGGTFGALNIYSAEANTFTQDEILLLEELAGDLTFGIIVLRDRIERKRAVDALRESEAKYRRIVDTAAEGVLVFGPDTVTTFVNARMAEMLGYSSDELVGRKMSDFMFEEDLLDHSRKMEARRRGESERYERRFRSKNGQEVWTLVSATTIFDDEHRFNGSFAMFTDISERKQAEDALHELNRKLEQHVAQRTAALEQANKELEEFLYSLSHDLRGPLRAINGFARLLLSDYKGVLDAEGRRYLTIVRQSTIVMGNLIDGILEFSRISRRDIRMLPVDMSTLTREVFEELRGRAPGRNIVLHLDDMPSAEGDPAMIRQVLVSLLSNAIKFTGTRPEAVIEVSGTAEGPENIYCVKDNGVGFDMAYVDKLFRVFHRLHSTEEFEGTGIGLAVVKRVVVRHGGRVWAESKTGEGASLYFTLPREAKAHVTMSSSPNA